MVHLDLVAGSSTPPRKRTKTENASKETKKTAHGRLFAPFRALGLITNHVPFVLQTRTFKGASEGPRVHILTCLGRSWALWEGGKMTLLFVGPDCPEAISCLLMDGDSVWASTGPHLVQYQRGKEVNRLTNPFDSKLANILVFGGLILALTEDGKRLLIWDIASHELAGSIEFENGFTATHVLHPATYLNKILVASNEGSMQLWNIRTLKCIYTFEPTRLRDGASKNDPCAITALVQSPAIDVVGIGFSSGEISIYDIRLDERLMRIFMDGGPVRSLAFRSDGHSVLASASASGGVAFWDLNENGRLLHIIRGAHDRSTTTIEWVPGQPLLISSGEDNSVKQWLFDTPTATPRLLKLRSGHHEPPHLIRYYGEDGKQLLTASRDRSLRCTSVVRDSRSFELSQGPIAKKATSLSTPIASLKLPPITSLSYSSTRWKDWDDVLSAHKQDSLARTWLLKDKKLGKWCFSFVDAEKEKKRRTSAGCVTTVCVTACGNFGLAGTSTGAIRMWNMQSGLKRKTFDIGIRPAEVTYRMQGPAGEKLKERPICGIATDALNRLVVAATSDGTLNFFDFHTTKLEHTLPLPATCSALLLQRDSGLLAVACDDLVVRIVDIETRRIVREMGGFRGSVLDMAFSPDSRWLLTTSMDSIIRTFDIPTGRLVDAFRTASIATSISFSPTGDFLATAHVDSVGVFLWANRAQYTDVSLTGINEEDVMDANLPSVQGTAEDEGLEALSSLLAEDSQDVFATPDQLAEDLITLTLLPRSRWQTLLHLDVIQQRNKPRDPPKAPEKAPFFLPTLPGVEHRFALDHRASNQQPASADQGKSAQKTKRLDVGAMQAESVFNKKLASEDPEGDYESLFTYLKTLSPAALDLELRALTTLPALTVFANALSRRLRSRRDFEAVQALIGAFTRMHGEVIVENASADDDEGRDLEEAVESLLEAQRSEGARLRELVASSVGALGFVRDVL